MASKDSEELNINDRYSLGEYSFRVERSAGTSPNYDKIEAICTKDGKNARKSIQVPNTTQMLGWYVEANETEASVYAILSDVLIPESVQINSSASGGGVYQIYPYALTYTSGSGLMTHIPYSAGFKVYYASSGPGAVVTQTYSNGVKQTYPLTASYTHNGKTVYYTTYASGTSATHGCFPVSSQELGSYPDTSVVWTMIYGSDGSSETKLVGRFAIDAEDAGGVGPGSDWEDPEDGGDPTYTLHVEVIGALSGRHNDPIVDPTYTYKPADKATVKNYGCGGDGGHGGGGGAGASTVVVHKFATNQAGNKEIMALAKRHGYGSGGGKGGKGGDGCILVYY